MFNWNKKEKPFVSFGGFGGGGSGGYTPSPAAPFERKGAQYLGGGAGSSNTTALPLNGGDGIVIIRYLA